MKQIAIAFLILTLTAPAFADELQELRDEVAALRARNAQLNEQLAELTREKERLIQQTEELTQQTEQLTELAGMTPQGDRVASQAALIETIYREDSDSTLVRSRPESLEVTAGTSQPHYLTLVYTYPGESPDGLARPVRWYIQSQSTDGDYRRLDTMTVTLDGEETLELPVLDYDSKLRASIGRGTSRRGSETLMFELDPDTVRRIAAATTVTGKMGVVEFKLSPDQIATFKAMRKRQQMKPQGDTDTPGSE